MIWINFHSFSDRVKSSSEFDGFYQNSEDVIVGLDIQANPYMFNVESLFSIVMAPLDYGIGRFILNHPLY